MKLGIAREVFVTGSDTAVLAEVDSIIADIGTPAYIPVWRSLVPNQYSPMGAPSLELLNGLHCRGITPMVFLESVGTTYKRILSGEHDETLVDVMRTISLSEHEVIVRWDQEPNSDWGQSWAAAGHDRYTMVSRYVAGLRLRPAHMLWTPIWLGRERSKDWREWYPGDDHVDYVGFDAYARNRDSMAPSNRWPKAVAALREFTQKPIIVGEFAITRDAVAKPAWIRDLANVKGIEGAVYFDFDRRQYDSHDWRMTRRMRKEYGRQMR